jgi:hypothetical protein
MCYYIHFNTDGKYIQTILELGANDASITNLNYLLSFGSAYNLIHSIICCFDLSKHLQSLQRAISRMNNLLQFQK